MACFYNMAFNDIGASCDLGLPCHDTLLPSPALHQQDVTSGARAIKPPARMEILILERTRERSF